MSRVVAITGATGFVGRHVAKALSDHGFRLRLLVRQQPDLELGPEPVELIPGNLDDEQALRELVEGAAAIVHIAGAIKARDRASFMAVNASGTKRVVAAREKFAPDANLIMISSLAAREPQLSHYAASKAAGEAHLLQIGGPWAILRPSVIYGPGDRETLTVFKMVKMPVHPLLNGPSARVCLVHVNDVVSAVCAVLNGGIEPGIYEVSDKRHEGYSWQQIVDAACIVMDTKARPVRVPSGITRALGRLGDMGGALFGSGQMLTSQKTRELLHEDWSSTPAAQLPSMHWKPTIGLLDGFRDAVRWYKDAGWLGR